MTATDTYLRSPVVLPSSRDIHRPAAAGKRREMPVFDRHLSPGPLNEILNISNGHGAGMFRRNDRNRAPISSNVTAQLMGDPSSGRGAR